MTRAIAARGALAVRALYPAYLAATFCVVTFFMVLVGAPALHLSTKDAAGHVSIAPAAVGAVVGVTVAVTVVVAAVCVRRISAAREAAAAEAAATSIHSCARS